MGLTPRACVTEAGEITEAGRLPGSPSCVRDISCVGDARSGLVRHGAGCLRRSFPAPGRAAASIDECSRPEASRRM